ncbi:hypothetical protein R4M06_03010 [Brachyspira pilosicoli]|uniref:hypothetical protein n=1 Tax=Brachyspira pilosicoli TaxID=52584 RepID=UPI003005C25E
MSKKFLSLILVLFLVGILAVSCSNADKTGSGDNNSGSTTPQGIAKYEGTWQLTDLVPTTILTISNNGAVTYRVETSTSVADSVTDKGNETYEVKFTPEGEGESIITLKFTDDSNGSFTLSTGSGQSGSGTLTKKLN